ncbi:hypothetical protein DFH06DRAFT_1136014 [Mycena polygramma]|nr:hypothetical protein DFH06DRAFT_1136014 [Mycena polygramma]
MSIQFPPNPNRPERTGRGEREARPTAGLQNHMEQQEKNRKKAFRAHDTRQQNGTVPGRRSAAGPLTSTTIQNSPLPAAATTATPHSSFAQQTPFAAPPPPHLQSHAPRPTPANRSQPSLPPSTPHSFSLPSPATTRLSLVPQNYTPAYPSYPPQPQPQRSQPFSSTPPSSDAYSVPADAMDIQRMLERMTPEQRTMMMNEALAMPAPPPFSSPAGQPDTYVDDPANPATMFTSLQSFDGTVRSFDVTGGGARLGANDDDEDLDSDAPERPWISPPDDGPGEDEPHGAASHQNAQSSLHVEMHDVEVRRKKLKRKRVARTDSSSDADDPEPSRPSQKQSRKKRKNRKRESRSIHQVDKNRRCVIEVMYSYTKEAICLETPFPIASESGDPAAEDDESQDIIEAALCDALEHLGIDPDDFDDLTPDEIKLVRSRFSQVRGNIVTQADTLVHTCFGFKRIDSLEDPTPEKIAEVREANRNRVAELTGIDGKWMYKNPDDISDLATICFHSIFQKLLNAAFFAEDGINNRRHYFAKLRSLPKPTFALMTAAIVCSFNRWKTGDHKTKGNSFDADVYRPVYQVSLVFIDKWIAEFEKDVYSGNIAKERLRELLTNARKLTDTSEEPEQPAQSMFPMHVFS